LHVLPEDGGSSSVIFSADGRVIAAAISPTQVRLRETETWRELLTLESPQALPSTEGSLSSDGGRLAITSPGFIRLWDLRAVREGLAAMDLDWNDIRGPTVGDHHTAGWGPPNLPYLERSTTQPAQ